METFQTLPNGDPSIDPADGANTKWHYHEPTGALTRKEYPDGHGPSYAYTPAAQLTERTWARSATRGMGVPVHEPALDDRPLQTRYEYDPSTAALTRTQYSKAGVPGYGISIYPGFQSRWLCEWTNFES